jgi:hypothetical protein
VEKDEEGRKRNEFVNKHNIGCVETTENSEWVGDCEVRGIAMAGFMLIKVTRASVRYN